MYRLHLIRVDLCPFVQRSVITLLEEQAPFEITSVDLADEPDRFLKSSPSGKVPVPIYGLPERRRQPGLQNRPLLARPPRLTPRSRNLTFDL